MSTQIKNAGQVGRSDLFAIYPEFITADPANRGRTIIPSQADVEALAHSIVAEGQLQPVTVRKGPDKKLHLVLGFTRHAAVTWANESGLASPKLKLQCKVTDCNDEEAFRKNIVENRERNVTTPVDDAFNQRRLREEFSWSDEQIAEFYKLSKSRIDQLKKLLTLPKDIQAMVGGLIVPQAAILMADMPVAQQRELVRQFKETNTELLQAVKEQAAEVEADGEPEQKTAPENAGKRATKKAKKAKPTKAKRIGVADVKKHARDTGTNDKTDRSLKEVKKFFEERYADKEEDAPVKEFAKAFLRFCKGELDDDGMVAALHKLEG